MSSQNCFQKVFTKNAYKNREKTWCSKTVCKLCSKIAYKNCAKKTALKKWCQIMASKNCVQKVGGPKTEVKKIWFTNHCPFYVLLSNHICFLCNFHVPDNFYILWHIFVKLCILLCTCTYFCIILFDVTCTSIGIYSPHKRLGIFF